MSDLLSSKISIEEEQASFQSIAGQATAVGMCVGIAEKGPIGVATLVTSEAQWRRIFGTDIAESKSASAVAGFFGNGGRFLYFTRTVHYDNGAAKSAKATLTLATDDVGPSAGTVLGSNVGPFALAHNDTVVVVPDGGSPATATITATRAQRSAGNAAPYALSNNHTLLVKVDGGLVQTVTFLTSEFSAIGAATAAEVAAVINAKLGGAYCEVSGGVPRISSDTLGTSSHIEVTGGTGNTALGFVTTVVNGTGNVPDVSQVSVAQLKTIIEAAVSGVTVSDEGGAVRITSNTSGASSSVQVQASSTADDELGFDNATHSGSTGAALDTLTVDAKYDGTYANDVTILITEATSAVDAEFNLAVLDDGVVVERFPNLSMDATAERYVESVINDVASGSQYIEVTDLVASGSAATNRPVSRPSTAFGPLTGGLDGLAGDDPSPWTIGDADFIGNEAAKTGIRSFDQKEGNILFVPDRPTAAVHSAMLTYCDVIRQKSMFAIIDPPAGLTASQAVTYFRDTAALINLSEHGAAYWPQVRVVNPSPAIYGSDDTIVVPPGGHIAGTYARVDASRVGGVYDPPGGVINGRLFGVVGLENDSAVEEATRDLLYPNRINPISRLRGTPFMLDGVRTLRNTNNFPTIAERRGVIFIEQALRDGLQFARLRNNDALLRAEVERSVKGFLLAQMRVGAFRSRDPRTAFWVDVSDELNPQSEIFAGRLNIRIGLATQRPAEFVVLSFAQDTRALDEELAAAAS
jgi:hypothetical protein